MVPGGAYTVICSPPIISAIEIKGGTRMTKSNMDKLGLNSLFEQEAALYKELYLARVSAQHKDFFMLVTASGEVRAQAAGKLQLYGKESQDYPAVGDWVMVDRIDNLNGNVIIHHRLKRKSALFRKSAGKSNDSQIIAANIDIVFICMSLNNDFNLRRLERYLSIAWDSGANPVVVLTKADLCYDLSAKLAEVYSVAIGVDVLVTTSIHQDGYGEVSKYLSHGTTVAFIGSSGVGKSTLINRLIGKESLVTREIRADDKGRHTTTHRQLLLVPDGGVVIDTPGMRELQLESADLARSFSDIEELAKYCRFGDCAHSSEPGCAVNDAIKKGKLSVERLQSYIKLQNEMSYQGLNSRQVEQEKINRMFKDVGGKKQARDLVKFKQKFK